MMNNNDREALIKLYMTVNEVVAKIEDHDPKLAKNLKNEADYAIQCANRLDKELRELKINLTNMLS